MTTHILAKGFIKDLNDKPHQFYFDRNFDDNDANGIKKQTQFLDKLFKKYNSDWLHLYHTKNETDCNVGILHYDVIKNIGYGTKALAKVKPEIKYMHNCRGYHKFRDIYSLTYIDKALANQKQRNRERLQYESFIISFDDEIHTDFGFYWVSPKGQNNYFDANGKPVSQQMRNEVWMSVSPHLKHKKFSHMYHQEFFDFDGSIYDYWKQKFPNRMLKLVTQSDFIMHMLKNDPTKFTELTR